MSYSQNIRQSLNIDKERPWSRKTLPTKPAPVSKPKTPRPTSTNRNIQPVPEAATTQELAQLCGVTVRTARRWKERGWMPATLAMWVTLAVTGCMEALDERWKGWRMIGGELYGPDLIHGFSPADILSLPYVRAQVRGYQIEQRFPRQADFLTGKYERVTDSPALPARECVVLPFEAKEA